MTSQSKGKLEILKTAADISDWGYGRWAYEQWEIFNEQYWDGSLEPGGIFWGLTAHGQSLSSYESWRNAITLHKALVEPASNAWGRGKLLGKKFAADVLLHEMIHQALFQQGKVCPQSHNCEAWCDEINRLIPLMGIETSLIARPVKQRRIKVESVGVDGKLTTKSKVTWEPRPGFMPRSMIANFPHSLRSHSYYEKSVVQLGKKSGLLVDSDAAVERNV